MSEQIAVRLPAATAHELDELVRAGDFPTRADAVRAAISRLLEESRRQRIEAAIVEGYLRVPQTDEELAAAEAAAIRSIGEEPW